MKSALSDLWLSVALALGTALVYAGTLENEFVNFDDGPYIFENPMVCSGLSRAAVAWAFDTFQLGNWHPLTWLSLEADCEFFGLNARAYHATNLALHTANTVPLFWFIRLMTGAAGRSAWVAAFFALHPLHVESVAWAAERKDVLSTFFLLLCLLAWLAHVQRPAVWKYALSLVLFALSLMSKAMGVTLPLVLLLLDVWPLRRWPPAEADRKNRLRKAASLVVEKLPFCLLSGAIAATALYTQSRESTMEYGQSLPLAARLLTVPVNYMTYLWQTVYPVHLAVLYPHPGADLPLWKPLSAIIALVAITVTVRRARLTRPYLLLGWLWFLMTLLPVIGLVQVGAQATADRYMYLPMVGLLIAFCWAAYDLAGDYRWHPAALAAALTICLLNCAVLTVRQVAVWHDGVSLWSHALSITRPSLWACNQYGQALGLRGDYEEAELWFHQALAVDPTALAPNANLGTNLLNQRRPAEAVLYLSAALKSRKDDPVLLERLAVAEELQGHFDAALGYYEAALRLVPNAQRLRMDVDRLREVLTAHDAAHPEKYNAAEPTEKMKPSSTSQNS